MPTRRKFIESAAVVSAAPLAPTVVFANGVRRAERIGAVYDARYNDARLFGLRAEQWGVPVRAIEGDITDFWQRELRGRWNETHVAIAGLTERSALFMLEQLAWDYGLRVVFHAEHESRGPNGFTHGVLRATHANLDSQLDAAGTGWAAALADRMLTAPEQLASNDASPSGAAMAAYLNEPDKLYSWIIAPRRSQAPA